MNDFYSFLSEYSEGVAQAYHRARKENRTEDDILKFAEMAYRGHKQLTNCEKC